MPSGNVTVAVASTATAAATVSPASLTFTRNNWNQARTVKVAGVNDAVAGNRSASITHKANGGGYVNITATVAVTVLDDDGALALSHDGGASWSMSARA